MLDGMESGLVLSDSYPNALIIDDIRDKLNTQSEQLNERATEQDDKKEDVAL